VRESDIIVSPAVLIAIGIDWDGRRQVLAVELAKSREPFELGRTSYSGSRRAGCTASSLSWPTITPGSERHCARFLAEAAYQCCYVHFLD
jgi:transposase-like protein